MAMERSPGHPEPPMHSDGEWNVRTLKEYMERVVTDRDVALKLAVTELDRRLENLNNAHALAKEKERDFYSRLQHDDFAKTINDQLNQLRSETEALRRPNWQVWLPALTLLLSMVGAMWYFATQPIKSDIEYLKERDKSMFEAMKAIEKTASERSDQRAKTSEDRDAAINERINKLYGLYEQLEQQHFDVLRKK